MFERPRCREWTPLATQQLRLRNLIQIVGYNIRPPEWCPYQCSFYLTLHHTTMSAPFYMSERICSPHPKWKEIDSEIIQRISSTNVVIRIWCHQINSPEEMQDTIIQTWGVYLSGLRYIGANLASNFNSDCFKSNTLVFQMHGGYFCSYKSLKLDIIPPENELEHGSLSSDSSGRTNLSKNIIESKMINSRLKESRSISPSKSRRVDKEYSKSHSPVDRDVQNFSKLRNSTSLNIGHSSLRKNDEGKIDPSNIYEHTPDKLDVKVLGTSESNCDNSKNTSQEDLFASTVDLSETAEFYDLRNEYSEVPKYRYLALSFLKSEIRPSYNATKLQKLHLLQYSIKKRQEAVQEIKERIYKKSALNESLDFEEKLKNKSKSQRNLFSPEEDSHSTDKSSSQTDLTTKNGRINKDKPVVSNGPRLALKLNDLLSFKTKPSPFQRAEHVRLTKQLEILRFKRIILSDERDSKLTNIRRLKEKHAKLAEENQDVGTELMQNYHALSRRNDIIKETRQSCAALRELAARTHAALQTQRNELLTQLHQIFYIEHSDPLTWSICGVPLPICGDETPRSNAVSDAVAAGFAAQAVSLAAWVLHQPLRYQITLLGSASKILDVTPDLPDPNIPLYARGGDVTLFRYAMFLLNKCIGQLCAGRGLPIADIRPTLLNLQRLLTSHTQLSDPSKLYNTYRWLDNQCPRTQSLRSLVATDRGKYRQFNRFKDAVDGQSPQSVMNVRRHRHSKSVGSYHDDQEITTLDASITSIMGSESNIYNMKLTKNDSADLKPHNSDSEIQKLSENEDKVIFSLGDDDDEGHSKLVRISSNNGDELTDDVKLICSQITDFCSKDGQNTDCCSKGEQNTECCSKNGENISVCCSKDGKNSDYCPKHGEFTEFCCSEEEKLTDFSSKDPPLVISPEISSFCSKDGEFPDFYCSKDGNITDFCSKGREDSEFCSVDGTSTGVCCSVNEVITDCCSKDEQNTECCSRDQNITDLCSKSSENTECYSKGGNSTEFCSNSDTFDVAQYLRQESVSASEIEDIIKCLSCEGKGDSECTLECAKKVTDVIVIPSAEAILDTGQFSKNDS